MVAMETSCNHGNLDSYISAYLPYLRCVTYVIWYQSNKQVLKYKDFSLKIWVVLKIQAEAEPHYFNIK